jgi:polyhydroxybutyrate depolymerase
MLGLLAGLVLCACTPASPRLPLQAPMSYEAKVDVRFHGLRRTYRVHLPAGYNAAQPLPMVLVVHGAFDTAEGMERFTGFSALADQESFIVLYPNGIGILGYLQHWNAGHCCGKAAADGIDDVGFLTKVIEDACARLAVDRRRIYMTGFSNGGMMVHRFAAERGDLLAAVAPLAAAAGGRPDNQAPEWSIPDPICPMPLLAMHGLADAYVPFDGGASPARGDTRQYWPVKRSLDLWIQRNQCLTEPVTWYEYQGKAHVTTWQDPAHGADVVLYSLEGWGHDWPGPYFSAKLDARDPLRDFDAARIIWDFFKGHTR